MKNLYVIHILNTEGRNSYYTCGVPLLSIPFSSAKKIEFLRVHPKKKESQNMYPHFVAFQAAWRKKRQWSHSLKHRFEMELTGTMPFFSFALTFENLLKSIHHQG